MPFFQQSRPRVIYLAVLTGAKLLSRCGLDHAQSYWIMHVGSVPHCKWGFTCFRALASRSGFGATISDAVARSSIVFCNSVSADRIVMAASRLLRAVAAFVILLSFAAGLRKSYWSGCMKAATVICQQIFSILALVFFCST